MRVLLDTTYALRAPNSGTAVYLREIAAALRASGAVQVAEANNTRRRPPAGGGLGSLRNAAADFSWTALSLPLRARGADLIHHPLPARAPYAGRPQVVTVMDLAFERLPELFDPRYRAFARRSHRAAARRADAVICISETTAADAVELWGVARERVIVAALGPGQRLARLAGSGQPGGGAGGAPAARDGAAGAGAYFLYVGDEEPRKDLPTLLAAYAGYRREVAEPRELVIAGSARASGDGVRVIASPGVAQLAGLFAGALALVHPSRYEGFGLTALEAMSAGVPVLAARAPGVTEVCGDAALFAAVGAPGEFTAAMVALGADGGLRERLRAAGIARAAGFSWENCANCHVGAYALALNR